MRVTKAKTRNTVVKIITRRGKPDEIVIRTYRNSQLRIDPIPPDPPEIERPKPKLPSPTELLERMREIAPNIWGQPTT